MTIKKSLKNIAYEWDTDRKEISISKNGSTLLLNKSESGALQRFIFSMFQFHSHKIKAKKKNTSEQEPLL